jgi:hypothetical protein
MPKNCYALPAISAHNLSPIQRPFIAWPVERPASLLRYSQCTVLEITFAFCYGKHIGRRGWHKLRFSVNQLINRSLIFNPVFKNQSNVQLIQIRHKEPPGMCLRRADETRTPCCAKGAPWAYGSRLSTRLWVGF